MTGLRTNRANRYYTKVAVFNPFNQRVCLLYSMEGLCAEITYVANGDGFPLGGNLNDIFKTNMNE